MSRDHRISVPISEDTHRRLQKAFPWGTQSEAIRRVIEILLTAIEKDGYNTIYRLIAGSYDPLGAIKSDVEKEKCL